MQNTKGFIKIIVVIHEEINEDMWDELREDLEMGMRGSLDVQFDIPYTIRTEIHPDP